MSHRATVLYMFGYSIPSWMLAVLVGVLTAFLVREIVILIGMQRNLPLATVFYCAVALIAGILANYAWIGGF